MPPPRARSRALLLAATLLLSVPGAEAQLRYLRCETVRGGALTLFADGITRRGTDAASFEASADLNDDDVSDLVAVDDAGDVVVLLADGPSFDAGICTALTESVESLDLVVSRIDVANFDGDVNPDIAVLDDRSVSVLFNRIANPSGGDLFVPGVPRSTRTNPLSMVAADFDQDGAPDHAVGAFGRSVEILYGGSNDATPLSDVGIVPDLLISGDFNVDDRLDLLALSAAACSVPAPANARAILRDATNTRAFDLMAPFCVEMGAPSAVTLANFDRRSGDDVAVLQSDRSEVVVLLSGLTGGNVVFEEVDRFSVASSPTALSAGDFDFNGTIDLAVAGRAGSRGIVQIFLGAGDGTFTLVGNADDPCVDSVAGGCALDHLPGPMALAFLDADAAVDIVVGADSVTCVGDCNSDGCVSEAEVERINDMVGGPPASDCLDADANRDGVVTLDENTQAESNRQEQQRPTPSGPNDCDETRACPNSFARLTFLLSDNAPATPTFTRTPTGTRTATRTVTGTPTMTGTPTITGTRTGTGTRTRTSTPIPTRTCGEGFCVQGSGCANIVEDGGGSGAGIAPLLGVGLLLFLRAAALRRH